MGDFDKIEMPLVRRVYPQLVANNIVSVQPLLGPTGLVHYLRYRYSQNKQNQPTPEQTDVPIRKKQIRKKRYRSIDDPWESQ